MLTLSRPPACSFVNSAVRAFRLRLASLVALAHGWLARAVRASIIRRVLAYPWSVAQLGALIAHPDRPVRRWAADRLRQRYPADAPAALLPLLDDADDYLVLKAADAIVESGDAERFRAPLVERLPAARGKRFGRLAEALARLDAGAARPWLLERARRGKDGLDLDEYVHLAQALGHAGGPAERQALWEWLAAYSRDGLGAQAVVGAILDAAQPGDIRRLVQRLRSWPTTRRAWRTSLSALPSAVGAGRVFEEMTYAVDGGVPAMLARAAQWLRRQPPLDPARVRAMTQAFAGQPAAMFPVLLAEAQRLTQARGNDVMGWRAQWEAGATLTGYRRLAVFTGLVLEAFHSPLLHRLEWLPLEAMVGLALLCELSVGQDDEGLLARADDKPVTLIAILAQDRENVLPGVVEQVAEFGAAAAPALSILLSPGGSEWGAIRAARALARLARREPGVSQLAIPALLARVTDQEGDFVLEACAAALASMGPAVVEPIAAALNGDSTREIYLTGVLGEVGTDRAVEVLADLLDRRDPQDPRDREMYTAALTDTGSAAAIPLVAARWQPGDPTLAEHLLVLHAVNGLDHAQMPEWRRVVAAEDTRVAQLTNSLQHAFYDADQPLPGDDLFPVPPAPPARPLAEPPPRRPSAPAGQKRKRRRPRR